MSSVRNVRPFETSIRTKRLPETKYVRTKCLRAKRLRAKRLPCETSIRTKRLLASLHLRRKVEILIIWSFIFCQVGERLNISA